MTETFFSFVGAVVSIVAVAFFVSTQVVVPLVFRDPLFPSFRRRKSW